MTRMTFALLAALLAAQDVAAETGQMDSFFDIWVETPVGDRTGKPPATLKKD